MKTGSHIEDRRVVILSRSVTIDGRTYSPGETLEVSTEQAVHIVVDLYAGQLRPYNSIRPGAMIANESAPAGKRKPWRAARTGRDRMAPRGSIRLEAETGIVEQVRGIVGR